MILLRPRRGLLSMLRHRAWALLAMLYKVPDFDLLSREKIIPETGTLIFKLQLYACGRTLRHELRNPHDPGNYSYDWLDQSAASYMLARYSPQSFHIYFSDMGWRLASRAICPENVTVGHIYNLSIELSAFNSGVMALSIVLPKDKVSSVLLKTMGHDRGEYHCKLIYERRCHKSQSYFNLCKQSPDENATSTA
ncbi:hypothetical protein TNCV_2896441 [Trichonephila clavipes]|nr:hypothetical protein TNCV_2896441 [Trichonephila clavipes]